MSRKVTNMFRKVDCEENEEKVDYSCNPKEGWRRMAFADNLTKLRSERGMTQEVLAERTGVSRSTIAKWESGEGYPKIENLISLRNLLCITIDELLQGEKGMSTLHALTARVCNFCGHSMLRDNSHFWTCLHCGNRAFVSEDGKVYFQYENQEYDKEN